MRTVLAAPHQAAALILVDPAVYGEPPGWAFSWMSLPQMRHLGPWALRSLGEQAQKFIESTWHNPSLITAEIWAGYERPIHVQNWDRALWEYGAATRPSELVERLDQLALPVLIVVGADDRIVPLESQQKLHQAIPGSRLVIIPACGHLPQEECPEEFMAAINAFLSTLDIW